MKRHLVAIFSLFVLAGCATSPPVPPTPEAVPAPTIAPPLTMVGAVGPADAPHLHARHALMIDARTGETLYEKHADTRVQVASTQKLVTAMVLLDGGNLDESLTITRADCAVEPSKLGFRPGQTYTRRELLTAMLVKSENDAAQALARDHSGSIAAFAVLMNRKAWQLGARNSHFINPHGLPGPQYSTARDMARIAFHAYREPLLRRIMNTRYYTFVYDTGRTKRLENTNKLLGRSPIYNGMKTGYTNAAGRCLISSASVGGREVILVQLGSKTRYIFDDAERMMRWGLARAGFAQSIF